MRLLLGNVSRMRRIDKVILTNVKLRQSIVKKSEKEVEQCFVELISFAVSIRFKSIRGTECMFGFKD